jgi:hypothetical protein
MEMRLRSGRTCGQPAGGIAIGGQAGVVNAGRRIEGGQVMCAGTSFHRAHCTGVGMTRGTDEHAGA